MIQVTNLSKSFEGIQAVDNINFTIHKGEVFGLLGPNGAGKSTTLNMISTLLKNDSGKIIIDNLDVQQQKESCKKLLGVVPQEISLYEELSAYDNLWFWGKLYQIPSAELKNRIQNVLELIGLDDRKSDTIKTYSGGMKRRINIAAALLHKPKVLLLDEPTVGIDPQSRNRIFEVIEDLNQKGMTIVYTTHYMEEVERLCNRIAIIDNGKIIAEGTQSELKKLSDSKESIQLEFEVLLEKDIKALKNHLKMNMIIRENSLVIQDSIENLSEVISACNEQNMKIKDIQIHKINLESIFLSLTGKQLRD